MLRHIFDRPIWLVTPGRFALEMGLAIGFGAACLFYYQRKLRSIRLMLREQNSASTGGPIERDERMFVRVRRLIFMNVCVIAPGLEEAIFRGPAIFILRYSLLLAIVLGLGLNVLFTNAHGLGIKDHTEREIVRLVAFVFGIGALIMGLWSGSVLVPVIIHAILNARDGEYLPWQKWDSSPYSHVVVTKYGSSFRHIEFRQANDIHDD